MITASVILTWGLCALWGVFLSQSSVDLLATVSRLRTLSLSSISAFLQIAGSTNFKRLQTLDSSTVAALSGGADSFNILGDGFKNLKTDSSHALNSTPGPNTPFAPRAQGSLQLSHLVHIVLGIFSGIACLLAVYAVYEVVRYGYTGSSSTVEFIMQFKDGKSGAGTRIPADLLPTSEPTIILDLHPETPLATILGDAYVDRDHSHDATPEDVSYNPLAFISNRSPTSIPEVNIAVSSPISPIVTPSVSASPSLVDAVLVTPPPSRPLVYQVRTERYNAPAPLQTADSEREKTTVPIWHGVLYEVDIARLHQHVLDDPFDEPTPAPCLLPAFTIRTGDLHSGSLFTDDYQTPTPSPRPLPTTYTRSHSQEFWMPEDSDDEEIDEFLRSALNMQPDHNAPPRRGYWPRDATTPVWHPTRHELRAWRLSRLDHDDPFLDEPVPRPTLPNSPPLPSFESFASGLRPWSFATHSSSSSESSALETSASVSDTSSASLQAHSPTPASPFTTSFANTEEDDEQTHVFGIPLSNLNRFPSTHRDPDEDEIDEYNRIALNLPRDSSTVPSADWVLPSDYDEDWEEFDAVMCLFPPLPLPADMEDPYGEPRAPVDSPWDEDDDKTRVFGIPLTDLDRTPFTQRDPDEEELNKYLCAALNLKVRPECNVPPARGWWKGSEYDKAKLDEFLRIALTMPLDSALPSTGWLLPSGHDENRHRDELAAYAYPGFPIPEHLRIPVVRIPVDTG
ncbi:uncharacterized protein TRAVEDRAFT_68616 [Trametes versicolor FP-101664 SS1]|uniref:uncharacterized protein n=1 Tax=Trametes versicolor (strain FP-101664) TaxID=717944 RepID=UPI0004624423|nr:uncharacterized protein TRAVEDRAFT_68616 [Trametes versicolor FP-101664 SS1]EIW64922.1 hypothetical protein TRAVEDRAFT_68616 [Trametes versicolor FP-101664 SS1]